MQVIKYECDNGIAWIDLSPTSSEFFSLVFVAALDEVIGRLADQPDIRAIVLLGKDRGFPRGNPIADRPDVSEAEKISEVFNRIENCATPIIAAFSGVALNEGFELALAAHYRVCTNTTRFGQNYISLGSIPCFGGTQRLPRLAGAKSALEILLNAQIFSASQAKSIGLVDYVSQDDLKADTLQFIASEVAETGRRPTRDMVSGVTDPKKYQAQMAEAKKLVEPVGLPAAHALVECVQAAQLMPLETGLSVERSLYAECEESDEAVSLRYLMTAERRLGGRSGSSAQSASVLVVGADVIDAGLCVALLDAGFWVTAVERSGNLAGNLGGRVYQIYDQAVGRSRMSPALRSARLGHFEIMDDVPSRGEFDVVVDPGWLPADYLAKFLESLPASAGTPDVLLSTRLGEELDELSQALSKPLPVVGFHFEKSPHVTKTVEVFAPMATDMQAVSVAQDFFHSMKKLPIMLTGSAMPASVLTRKALSDAAEVLLLHGAEPKRIDGALEDFGFKKGPLAFRDEIGLDVGFVAAEQPATEALIAAGRTGRSAGLGYFRYTKDNPMPRSDSVVLWSLSKVRTDLNIVATEFSDSDIVALCVGAMLNVGVDLLANNRVQRASDVDVLAVHGLDFPRRKGGPMRAAENFGLFEIKQSMVKHKEKAPGLWAPKDLLLELIKYGQGFETMDIPELQTIS